MEERKTLYVGVEEIQKDWGVSKSKAYAIVRDLNKKMLEENPRLLVVTGKINRFYYEEVCMKQNA